MQNKITEIPCRPATLKSFLTQLECHTLTTQSPEERSDVPKCHRRGTTSLFDKRRAVIPTGQQGAQFSSPGLCLKNDFIALGKVDSP